MPVMPEQFTVLRNRFVSQTDPATEGTAIEGEWDLQLSYERNQ